MKKTIYLNVLIACLLTVLCACKQTNKKANAEIRVMDPVKEIPEWLKVVVEDALPFDSLNIWIPTNDLSSSSLIRVPRCPPLAVNVGAASRRSGAH